MIRIPKTETSREWLSHPGSNALVHDVINRQIPSATEVLIRSALNSADATVRHAAVDLQNLRDFLTEMGRAMKGAAGEGSDSTSG